MSIYNEPKDLELYHYGKRGMRWGQHIFGEFKSNLGDIIGEAKNKWDSLDSGLSTKNKTYDGFDNYIKRNKTKYNISKNINRSKNTYDKFKSNLGDIIGEAKNKWDSLDSESYNSMMRKADDFINNRFLKRKADSFTSKYKQSEIDEYINANMQRATEAIGRYGGQDFIYDKNKRTVDMTKSSYRDNDVITAQYLDRLKSSQERLDSAKSRYEDTKRIAEKYNLTKKLSDLLNSDVETIKEQEPIVNDYINKAIKSGSIASALGVGKYDDGISTSRSLNSLSKTSDRTLPYSDYYFHPADRVDGKSVARIITPEKKYEKYRRFY